MSAKLITAVLFILTAVLIYAFLLYAKNIPNIGMALLVLWVISIPLMITSFTAGVIMLIRALRTEKRNTSSPVEETGFGRRISPRISLLCGLAILLVSIVSSAVWKTDFWFIGFWFGLLIMTPWLLDALKQLFSANKITRLGVAALMILPAFLYLFGPELEFGPVAEEYFIRFILPLFIPLAIIFLVVGLLLLFSLFRRGDETASY